MGRNMIILFIFTLLAAELYQFSPPKVYLHFYPLMPEKTESIKWYVTAIVDRVTWLLTMLFFWGVIRKFKPELSKYAFIFVIYRAFDILAYVFNGSIAGIFYLIVYIPIILYGTYIIFGRQYWKGAEWIYSKIKRNG